MRLLQRALDLLPAAKRGAFWKEKILSDTALYPIHGSTGFLRLVGEYRRASR